MSDNPNNKNVTNWAMFCHLSAFLAYIGVPFGNILGPLIIWLVKKDESEFIDRNGKESLNFQISFTIYSLIAAVTVIGVFIIFILEIIFVIKASIKASNGEDYSYPLTIRFIK